MDWPVRGGFFRSDPVTMNFLHVLLQVIQAVCAILLIIIVMNQTSKESGMGGALGGGQGGGGGSRYSGGYEEKLDMTARNLVIGFLVTSLLVAIIGHSIG